MAQMLDMAHQNATECSNYSEWAFPTFTCLISLQIDPNEKFMTVVNGKGFCASN